MSSLSALNSCQVLVLSTGYEPLFKTNWKRAISAVFCGRAEVVETHDSLYIGTNSGRIQFPTIVRFLTGVVAAKIKNINRGSRPNKKTVWMRDEGLCQYCEKKMSLSESTIDHVIPKSKGGSHTWENVVISCRKCNQKKGSKLPKECGMTPRKNPKLPPTYVPFVR